MLHTSELFRRIHRYFIAHCYRRGDPAVTLCKAESCTIRPLGSSCGAPVLGMRIIVYV
jgi:hypothetical protein